MQRREDKKNEAERIKIAAEKAQARRRERRRCLREQVRIALIQEKILDSVFEGAEKIDYNTQVMIHDIRDYAAEAESEAPQALYVVGGFVGELIITFTALYDFMLANPVNEGFRFTSELMEKFLSEVVPEDYPADIASIKLVQDPLSKDQLEDPDLQKKKMLAAAKLTNPNCHASFGLRFLMEVAN